MSRMEGVATPRKKAVREGSIHGVRRTWRGGDATARESRELYQMTLDALPASIAILGVDGRVLTVNAAWLALMQHVRTGQALAEHPGQTLRFASSEALRSVSEAAALYACRASGGLFDHARVYRADGTTPLAADELPTARAAAGEMIRDEEYVLERSDGSRVVVVCDAAPFRDSDGRITGSIVTCRDITARRAAEEERERTLRQLRETTQRLEAFVSTVNRSPLVVMMWRVAPGCPVEFVTDNVCWLGYEPDDFTSGRVSWGRIIHSEDLPRREAEIRRCRENGVAAFAQEYRLVTRAGVVRWVDDRTIAICDADGRLTHYAAAIRDITERKHTENALRQAAAELARSNADLEQFAYVASHDLKEPLRMVSGFVQLLRDNYAARLDERASEYIAFAVDGALRMQALVDDLLAYSRVGRTHTAEQADVGEVVDVALANLRGSIDATGADITCEPMPTLRANRRELVQVFQNLIGNAIKFQKPGVPPVVHVSARRIHEPHAPGQDGTAVAGRHAWMFSVRDNGIGIEQESLDRVFTIFHRLHSQEEYPGTGLGLALCRKSIERQGGRIWAESAPGQGSTFIFTLPVDG